MGVHACQRAGVKLGSKVLVCGAGEDKGEEGIVGKGGRLGEGYEKEEEEEKEGEGEGEGEEEGEGEGGGEGEMVLLF